MDQARIGEAQYRLTHRHADGSWGEMIEMPLQHDPAAHDPERRWGLGRLFRCSVCDEAVSIAPAGAGGGTAEEGDRS